MAAIPDHGITQGKRKLRLVIDSFEGIGRGNPVFSVVDVETGEAIAGVERVLYKPEEGVAYAELRITNIEIVSAKPEEQPK